MRRIRYRKIKSVSISVARNFSEGIETEKKKFMKKQGLNKLSTTAFTEILSKMNLFKNAKKNK